MAARVNHVKSRKTPIPHELRQLYDPERARASSAGAMFVQITDTAP